MPHQPARPGAEGRPRKGCDRFHGESHNQIPKKYRAYENNRGKVEPCSLFMNIEHILQFQFTSHSLSH